jgi:hypothetical protein
MSYDQTLCAPNESDTGIVASDDTMAAPEVVDGETAIIADGDAVAHLDQLAWSDEQDAILFPDTGSVEVAQSGRSWWLAVGIGAAVLATAGLIMFDAVLLHHSGSRVSGQTTTPTRGSLIEITQPLGAPASTVTAPAPVTVVPPAVTVMAIPPTITQTIAPNLRAVFPTPAPRKIGIALFDQGIAEAPPSDRMPSTAEALANGREACTLLDGQTRTQTDDVLAAEHFSAFDYGTAFASADWIVLQAQHHLC